MIWKETDPRILPRVLEVVDSWKGTKYMSGQQVKGIGVDCFRFVCGVLDELYGRAFQSLIPIPHDVCMHKPETAKAAMREVLRRYDHEILSGVSEAETGDVIVTGSNNSPGHALIAVSGSFWHQDGTSVGFTSIHGLKWPIVKVCRPLNKELWIC